MGRRLAVKYATASDLRAHLEEHEAHGVMMLPTAHPPELELLLPVVVAMKAEAISTEVTVEVVQILSGVGLVVRLLDRGALDLAQLPPPNGPAQPPVVSQLDETSVVEATIENGETIENGTQTQRYAGPAGSSVLSWSVEKLQAEWDSLAIPERIRVARYGNRGARLVAARGRDKTMQVHLLSNPKISIEEVASLAGSATLDPALLRRIASNREWLSSPDVTRGLICNPKLPLPEVERLLRGLSHDELARLNRSGRIRASVKQAIQKRLALGKR